MLTKGDRVERYEVVDHLGGGGTAEVFLVRHVELHTRYALKVMTLMNASMQERFLREGRIQAQLDHPNIVNVHDVLRVHSQPALLMDFVEGPAMDTLLGRYTPHLAQVDQLARQVLAGVAHAHDHGLVHRDLKPANVLIEPHTDDIVARVADFGLAKLLDPSPDDRRTRTGAVMGTPAFMAPEQIRSSAKVDKRADVFALGCVLYELVCGAPAFVGHDLISLHTQMADRSWRPVRDWIPSVPHRMERAIVAALEPDPDGRPDDARALLAMWVDGTPMPTGAWEPEHIDFVRGLAPTASGPAPGVAAYTKEAQDVPRGGESGSLSSHTWSAEEPPVRPVDSSGTGRRPVPWLYVGVGLTALLLAGAAGVGVVGVAWVASQSNGPPDDAGDPVAGTADGHAGDAGAATRGTQDTAIVIDPPEPAAEPAATAPRPIVAAAGKPPTAARTTGRTEPGTAEPGTAEPEPVASSGTADPEPVVAPSASPVSTSTPAVLAVTGVDKAWMVDPRGRERAPGTLSPGLYRLVVRFGPGDERLEVMTVELGPGEKRTISCVAALRVCR